MMQFFNMNWNIKGLAEDLKRKSGKQQRGFRITRRHGLLNVERSGNV
jgi:hypothetical protein